MEGRWPVEKPWMRFKETLSESPKRFFLFSKIRKTNLYLFFLTIDLLFVVCLTRALLKKK